MIRLLLVRHAPTGGTRRRAFPGDEPLDAAGHDAAAALRGTLPGADRVLCSPARRCRETAAAAGLHPVLEPRLAECDFGAWTGRTLDAVDPDGARAWITEPGASPHGGESLTAFAARVAGWLRELADGCTLAITHGGVIRAAVAHALGAPVTAVWQIEAAPLSLTELHAHDGAWSVVHVNCGLA